MLPTSYLEPGSNMLEGCGRTAVMAIPPIIECSEPIAVPTAAFAELVCTPVPLISPSFAIFIWMVFPTSNAVELILPFI
ncbi:MAG: hypothetical protein BWY32_02464 [bacterium ADurb.Bin243]|nr:MAG: hypothetical protein BWY32_02464 [bacterium ADurb.Bin243]